MRIDFEVSGGGTVHLFKPLTPASRAWVDDHLPEDATRFCGAVVVENCSTSVRLSAPRSATADRVMSRYIKETASRSIDEDFIALVLLVGPLAWPSRRREGEVSAESPDSPRRSR